MMASDMMTSDMMTSDMMTACEGIDTLPHCLSLTGSTRGLDRNWSDLAAEEFSWGEQEELEISVSFTALNEIEDDSVNTLLSTYLPTAIPSGESKITATPLWITSRSETSSIEINVDGLKADRIFQAGYQSWSFSGAIDLPPTKSLDNEGHVFVREALTGDPFHGAQGVSFGLIGGQLGQLAEQGVWLIGQLDPSYTVTAFTAAQGPEGTMPLSIRIGFEDLPLRDQSQESASPSGAREGMMTQELSLITAPTMWLALRAYQELLKQRLELLRRRELRSAQSNANAKRPPRGWYSWNERFEDIDNAYIMEHVNLIAEKLSAKGFKLVEIDDGWQEGWGDWRINDRFPDDFEAIVEQAHQLQLTLGLWFAPFLVDVEVASRLDYPNEWFVFPLEESNEPLEHRIIGNPRTYYILDASHPDAMTHVLTELAARAAQGFTYFKLDFLYAAAIPGRRAQELSGTESLRLGLAKIREVIGQEVFINACGAPVHAVLGYADSLRVGADTTFGELFPAFIASAARSTAARAYLYPQIWPDGDQVQVRSPYLPEEATTGAFVAALSSAAYSIGDDLTSLPEDRLELFLDETRLWWADLPSPALPVDLMERPSAEWFANPIPDHLRTLGGTSAPPPRRYLGISEEGELRLLDFNWNAPFTTHVESLNRSLSPKEDQK